MVHSTMLAALQVRAGTAAASSRIRGQARRWRLAFDSPRRALAPAMTLPQLACRDAGRGTRADFAGSDDEPSFLPHGARHYLAAPGVNRFDRLQARRCLRGHRACRACTGLAVRGARHATSALRRFAQQCRNRITPPLGFFNRCSVESEHGATDADFFVRTVSGPDHSARPCSGCVPHIIKRFTRRIKVGTYRGTGAVPRPARVTFRWLLSPLKHPRR